MCKPFLLFFFFFFTSIYLSKYDSFCVYNRYCSLFSSWCYCSHKVMVYTEFICMYCLIWLWKVLLAVFCSSFFSFFFFFVYFYEIKCIDFYCTYYLDFPIICILYKKKTLCTDFAKKCFLLPSLTCLFFSVLTFREHQFRGKKNYFYLMLTFFLSFQFIIFKYWIVVIMNQLFVEINYCALV